jgi:hypothetical protein
MIQDRSFGRSKCRNSKGRACPDQGRPKGRPYKPTVYFFTGPFSCQRRRNASATHAILGSRTST